jgi:hypothetical protein
MMILLFKRTKIAEGRIFSLMTDLIGKWVEDNNLHKVIRSSEVPP